jgi:predicted component of type VI protein secretion system
MELNLTWLESNQLRSYLIHSDRQRERPARVGRDPLRSDVVIGDPTVSGLHVAVFYDPDRGSFWLENLRDSNPAIVNGKKVATGAVALENGAKLQLGAVVIQVEVRAVELPLKTREYGLKCPNPKCGKVSPYDHLKLVCPWCGTSLAAAQSVIIPRG